MVLMIFLLHFLFSASVMSSVFRMVDTLFKVLTLLLLSHQEFLFMVVAVVMTMSVVLFMVLIVVQTIAKY